MTPADPQDPPPVTLRHTALSVPPLLFTDLYELTMLQAYVEEGLFEEATFSLSARELPASRRLLLTCGQTAVVDYLQAMQPQPAELEWLQAQGRFSTRFLDWLAGFRFTGSVRAVAEGTPLFAAEPMLEITAPLPQAQLVETAVMNLMHGQTALASKALRIVRAAAGRPVMDFGARRCHGPEAALLAARAFHIAGVSATSNVLAGQLLGLPVAGTMAHAYVQAHDDEAEAFAAFARVHPDTVLLVDTYDSLAGVDKVIALAKRLGEAFRVRGIRLDSGDLLALSRAARRRLDEAGLQAVQIVASGGLDEHRIAALLAEGAPIDAFGVGSSMAVARDAPGLDLVYKLCAYAGQGRTKRSPGKAVLPGAKQVFRRRQDGRASGDVIARAEERLDGEPLLQPWMRDGRPLPAARLPLDAIREHARQQLDSLPESLLAPDGQADYPVAVSPALAAYEREVLRQGSD